MFKLNRRVSLIYVITVLAFLTLVIKLCEMQLVRGKEYSEISGSKISVNMAEEAPRGEITDRYGEKLVGNKASYSIVLLKTDIGDNEFNDIVLKLLNLLEQEGIYYKDSLPISPADNSFTFENDEEKEDWFEKYGHEQYINPQLQPSEILTAMAKDIYHLTGDYTASDIRKIIGVRYDAEMKGFSPLTPFVIADDVSVGIVSKIKESSDVFSCVEIVNTYVREYYNNGYASHLLGRIGKLDEDEYNKYKDSGYDYNDVIGKQGIEKLCEQYLRGVDGVRGIDAGRDGSITLVDKASAQPGSNIITTIDMDLQRTAEDSLKKRIERISSEGGLKTGEDANAGAVVVVDVKTGDLLACASYPTFDLSTFQEDYSILSADENKPLWNRAVSGTYTPGSTFKPLVALAALESGNLKPNEKITDEGVYRYYEGYRPRCWIWSEYHTTHGSINVSQAIEKSCNYFFYEVGRRMGIDKMVEFASKFGLGEYTGVGLPEEVKGYCASPESKKNVVKSVAGQGWVGADTLQAAIGQSIHNFTPAQIANYIATIANGGTRYKLNLIKSIRSGVDGSLVYEHSPEVVEKIEIKPENLAAVKLGMKNVVEEGSARAIFDGYPIKIGGKTGTAQLGTKSSNNALFAAYAPYDNPEIAVCVVIEHGVSGSNAAYVAKDIFDEYFNLVPEAVSAFNEQNNLD